MSVHFLYFLLSLGQVADSSVSLHPQLEGGNEDKGDGRGDKPHVAEGEDEGCLPPLVTVPPHRGGKEECQQPVDVDEYHQRARLAMTASANTKSASAPGAGTQSPSS